VPRVSVVIATYNWSSVLPFSIGSVLAQTMRDFEVLVVGDGCTDDSAEVVATIGDPRVRWINLPARTGHQSAPNNEGLRQARGDVIAYLGHDDLWFPHHLEAHLAALEEAAVAYSLITLIAADGSIVPAVPWPSHGVWSPPSAMTHRRSMTEEIGGWRDYREVAATPEVDLFRRAASRGFSSAFVPRLTAIKFPAALRRDVYRERPSHEQAHWAARMRNEGSLEATLLARMFMARSETAGLPYRELVRQTVRETTIRMRRRMGRRSDFIAFFWRRKGGSIDAFRRFKGAGEI
jgi:glycosyltransferase involved in cell wall biosynthesis